MLNDDMGWGVICKTIFEQPELAVSDKQWFKPASLNLRNLDHKLKKKKKRYLEGSHKDKDASGI